MTWGHPGLSSRDSLALTGIDHEQGEIAPTRRSNPFAAYHKTGLKTMPCRAPYSPPKIVGMAFVGLQQVWGVNRGVDRALRGVSERIGNG